MLRSMVVAYKHDESLVQNEKKIVFSFSHGKRPSNANFNWILNEWKIVRIHFLGVENFHFSLIRFEFFQIAQKVCD